MSTPLHNAAKNGHEPVVKLLLKTAGVDVNATDRFMNNTRSVTQYKMSGPEAPP
jgi:ankyrin repeat protein